LPGCDRSRSPSGVPLAFRRRRVPRPRRALTGAGGRRVRGRRPVSVSRTWMRTAGPAGWRSARNAARQREFRTRAVILRTRE
jgi:hypothetical protein